MPTQRKGLGTLDPSGGVALFTDGSAFYKDGSGGWAWVAIDLGDGDAWGCGGASGTTNNRMEIQAWIEGLNALYDAHGACEILVYSDSEYVGLGITQRARNRRKNLDLWKALEAAVDQHEYVEWVHVKGHFKGAKRIHAHDINERVDKLASKARKKHREGKS